MVAPAPRLLSGLGGRDHTVPTYPSPGMTPPPTMLMGPAAAAVGGGAVVVQMGHRPLTPGGALGLPDYGTTGEYRGEHEQREDGAGVKFSSIDYNQKRYHAEVPVADTYAFFTAHRDPKDFMMRWLHLEGLDRLTILRFAVKYSLHPLCVEDALKLEDQQPKVNIYGSHYFVVMPFFRLTHESRRALDALRQQRRRNTSIIKSTAEAAASLKRKDAAAYRHGCHGAGPTVEDGGAWSDFTFRVEWSKLCLFVAGPPAYDTLISLHSKWELFNAETDEIKGAGGGGGGSSGTISSAGSPTASMAGGHGTPSPSGSFVGADGGAHGGYIPAGAFQRHQGGDCGRRGPRSHAFESLVSALRVEYSVLRQGDSRHLL